VCRNRSASNLPARLRGADAPARTPRLFSLRAGLVSPLEVSQTCKGAPMFHRFMPRKLPVAAVVVSFTLACGQADAQVEPFKVTGGGTVDYIPFPGDPPAFHFAVGTATHLGKYYGEGKVQMLGFTGPTTAD